MLPVILVATDQNSPTQNETRVWMRHLKWSQEFFHQQLSERDTFEFAKNVPDVVRLKRPLAYYKSLGKSQPALHWTAELLDHYAVSRFQCPYTFCCLVMNARERWPIGGGRTINGGINRGGGLLVMSSFAINRLPNTQSTLRDELAHTCGLPHVDVYRYDMTTSHSVMAYNQNHRTNGFRDSPTPPEFIPEDVRALSLAQRVFPKLRFSPERDLPARYNLFPQVTTLGPMLLPGHPVYGPVLTTPSGEDNGSKVTNVNRREILPSAGPGITYRQQWMWASSRQPDGHVVLNLTFPAEVSLTRLVIHSEHSGKYNRAHGIRIETSNGNATRVVTEQPILKADASVEFTAATARDWRLTLKAGPTNKVCLRGLQYFSNERALFPPAVPYDWRQQIGVDLPAFPPKQP